GTGRVPGAGAVGPAGTAGRNQRDPLPRKVADDRGAGAVTRDVRLRGRGPQPEPGSGVVDDGAARLRPRPARGVARLAASRRILLRSRPVTSSGSPRLRRARTALT